jgi:aspartate racemase
MHKVADKTAERVTIPILHIVDPTADRIREAGHRRIGLLGTAFTMEQDFYKGRLAERYGLEVLVPGDSDRKIVHDVIYQELVAGKVLATSREQYRRIVLELADQGAEAIILGCTEIMMLVSAADSPVAIFDTTEIHALAAVDRALSA